MRWFLILAVWITACGSNSALTELGTRGGRVGAGAAAGTGGISGSPSTIPTKKLVAKIITAAGADICTVLSDGRVQCWGNNENGAVGAADLTTDTSVPVTVSSISTARAVATGLDH